MATTDEMIALLSEQAVAVTPSPRPLAVFVKWAAGCFLYVAALLLIMGLRDDLAVKLESPLFLTELALLSAIVVSTSIGAITLSFPDLYQKKMMVWGCVVPLALFIAFLSVSLRSETPSAVAPPHGIECLACITLLSLLPAAWIMFFQHRQASTHYYLAGGIALLAASSIGCLTLRFSEETDSFAHLVGWHYLPVIGFGVIGLWLGKKILKW